MLERIGLADREAHIATLDRASKQRFGGFVGKADRQPFDDDRRLIERIDEGAQGGRIGRHRGASNRLPGASHL
jgi:hypothetical protein